MSHNDGTIEGISASERAEILNGVTAEMIYWKDAPARFFKAWKEAAQLVGAPYFGDGTAANLKSAAFRDQLAPNLERCTAAMGYLSSGEKTFLAVLYSFYNRYDAEELLKAADFRGMADFAGMDLNRRRIITQLMENFTGW